MSTAYNCVSYDRDRMRSCIYGLAIGDALGVSYGFCERDAFECTGMVGGGTHGQYVGTPAKGDLRHRYGYIASRPVEAVESDGYREHTLEAAPRCFSNTFPYTDCVLAAVNLGDDTDTTAAVIDQCIQEKGNRR